VSRYLATVLPGLEDVAADELAAKVPHARVVETRRGRLVVDCSADAHELLQLRTVDNFYLSLGAFEAGPHRVHLSALGEAAARHVPADIPSIVQRFRRTRSAATRPVPVATLWVNASRVGKQSYSRFEAAQATAAAVLRRHPAWRLGSEDAHSVELRLDVEHDRAWLSARLTPPEFRYRGAARQFAPAALRPTVAHALVWLSRPETDDVFLDPFCGSGTILAERAVYPARRLLGGDASVEALATARANLPVDDVRIHLEQWDARRIPLESQSVSALVSNLPFGHQVLTPADLPPLYLAFSREVQRLLAPGAHAIVLTEQDELLLAAVEKTRLRGERALPLSLKGLHPWVIRLALQ
jgi:tRNA (guanine6-N2)-methyltransferase